MEVILAKSAGFCFGVKRAVDTVVHEIEARDLRPIYTYGPIIHNENVVEDFAKKGVRIIEENADLDALKKGTVIIRSHGVKKTVVDELTEKGFQVVDATCPFVKKIHRLVAEASQKGDYIVIVGNPNHPEVQGIVGWVDPRGHYSVISDHEEAAAFTAPEGTKITVVSQTTFNYKKFTDLVEIIQSKGYYSNVVNTICNATEVRQSEAADISQNVDAMLVVGGRSSSNTQKLYEICSANCGQTYFIQTAEDLTPDMIRGAGRVGITAGASTPNNIIEEVQTACQN